MSKTAGFTVTVFASCLDPGFGETASNITEVCTDNLYVDSICELSETERIKCVCHFETDSPFMVPNCEWKLIEQSTTTTTVLPETTEELTTVVETTEISTISSSTVTPSENQYCSENKETFDFESGKLVCFDGYCELDCDLGTVPARLINHNNGYCSKYSHPKRVNCSDIVDHQQMKCVSQCRSEV